MKYEKQMQFIAPWRGKTEGRVCDYVGIPGVRISTALHQPLKTKEYITTTSTIQHGTARHSLHLLYVLTAFTTRLATCSTKSVEMKVEVTAQNRIPVSF
jgi:hypothetical protein